jgi:predicted nucleic acid-binding protein
VKPGLPDVNVLIALIDPAHQFHGAAHSWFAGNRGHGWATCPLTENGCVRIMSKAGYPYPGLTVSRVRDVLFEMVQLEGHRFWGDTVSILEPGCCGMDGAGPKNLTDLYLVMLARKFGGCLVTFDKKIPWRRVAGCEAEDVRVLGGVAGDGEA